MKKLFVILILFILCYLNLMADFSDGLVAHYPFNGNANDESGNGNNGTVNGATLTNDRFGNPNSAFMFDGNNDYIALNDYYENGNSLAEFTVSVWYKTSFSGTDYMENWSFYDFDRSEWFNVYIRGDNGKLAFSGSDGINDNFDIYANTSSNDNNWHHGVVIFDSGNNFVKFYLDGVLDGIHSYTNMNSISDSFTRYGFIGDGSEATVFDGDRNDFCYDGLIDDIRFYNRILTDEEIQHIYTLELNADFKVNDTSAFIGYPAQFEDLSSIGESPISAWEWDFDNDGTIDSYEQNPEWTYNTEGTYTVSLTITDTEGRATSTETKNDYINVSIMDLSSGLIAYYPFNANAIDESGNGNDGTVSEALLCEDRFEYINTAYNFDGANDYIHLLSDEAADSLGTYFSVSVWFKSESISGDTEGRIITRDRSDYWCIYADQSQSYPQDMKFSFDNGNDFTFTDVIADNAWHMATATWNLQSNKVKFYFDSIYKNSFDFTGFTNSTRPIIVGDNTEADPNPGVSPFDGKIDDIRLYNRALSVAEIQVLYHQADWPFLLDFTATPRFGDSSLEVNFTDISNNATGWEWDFQNDDIIDSYEQNPVFTYLETGMYDVKLIATFGAVIDSLVKTNFIIVQESNLSAPQNLYITISGLDTILSWDSVPNANYYLIYATNNPYSDFNFLDYTTTEVTYTHLGIISEKDRYFYFVIGFDGTMEELTRFIDQNQRKRNNTTILRHREKQN